ncbi:GFA family protein [Tepidamorphus sp. 3E244]|uniref:GFA family protein n=1 Tax=Tepidamorphus sp. 3E244 TaxID=3385498 RepID=UPI0038FC02EF
MSDDLNKGPFTGGCQCGAIRYRVEGPLTHAHVCHCRMCQKAAGNYFMPLANAQKADFSLTRGTLSVFSSSRDVERGFCAKCGTPLTFDTVSAPHLNLVLGSLDDPASVKPQMQYGTESKMPWLAGLDTLPAEATEDSPDQDGVPLEVIQQSNSQHPDHDTDNWPPEDRT